jgi:hypothetical protein
MVPVMSGTQSSRTAAHRAGGTLVVGGDRLAAEVLAGPA